MTKSNFKFLKGVNDILYRLALAAERNFPQDPNTTMVKLRMFGEAMARHVAQMMGIQPLDKIAWVDDAIISVFHKLRKIGNEAVHAYHDDRYDAENTLRLAYRLAIWYYRVVKKEPNFAAPLFALPDNAADQKKDLSTEVESLQKALKEALNIKAKSNEELTERQQTLTALEGQIAILEAKQEETEAQNQARIAALEAQLKAKDEALARKTDAARKAHTLEFYKLATNQSLDLSEQETRFLIDEQLRQAGLEVDTSQITYDKGHRPVLGKKRAISEWPTADGGIADYVLFAGFKPVAIVEAKRKNKDVSGKLNQAENYSIHFDHAGLKNDLLNAAADDKEKSKIETSYKELCSWPDSSGRRHFQIPFIYSTNGRPYRRQVLTKSGIWFRDVRSNTNAPRALPIWHQPGELLSKLAMSPAKAHQWLNTHQPDKLGLRYLAGSGNSCGAGY